MQRVHAVRALKLRTLHALYYVVAVVAFKDTRVGTVQEG